MISFPRSDFGTPIPVDSAPTAVGGRNKLITTQVLGLSLYCDAESNGCFEKHNFLYSFDDFDRERQRECKSSKGWTKLSMHDSRC